MYLVGIDPGLATGVAVWDLETGSLDMGLTGEYDPEGFFHFLRAMCSKIDSAQVEFFTISTRTVTNKTVDYNAVHLIGAIKFAAWQCGYPIEFTNPADVKVRFPDKALKKAGIWHKSDHVRDAIRHLLHQLLKRELFDARKLLVVITGEENS
jgi:hypothetical protein